MKLKWYGHASFRVTADNGVSIITDPYGTDVTGYAPVTETADIVIASSDNDVFHCRWDLIPGSPTFINALEVAQNGGTRTEHGITFHAIEAMEALDHAYHDPDQNGMYRFEVDGVKIGHLGDVGNPLSAEQMDFFKGVDVLLSLVGGHPTIDLDDLKIVHDTVKPKLIVPMHFRTLTYKPRNSFWIQTFLDYFDPSDVDFLMYYETRISPDTLPDSTRVLVMDYAR